MARVNKGIKAGLYKADSKLYRSHCDKNHFLKLKYLNLNKVWFASVGFSTSMPSNTYFHTCEPPYLI